MAVDLNNLKCRNCGVSLPKPNYRLTYKGAANRMCPGCRGQISRSNGRIPSEINASVPVGEEQLQVLLGSLLGDGGLEAPPKGSIHWGLAIKHSLKQTNYALHKANLLGALVRSIRYPKDRIRIRTVRHPILSNLAQSLIKDGRKSVSPEVFQQITPLGLAVWYMDDGCLTVRTKKDGTVSGCIRLATHSFTLSENEYLRDMLLQKFGIPTSPYYWKNPRNLHVPYEGIYLGVPATYKFLTLIDPFMIGAGMDYKRGWHLFRSEFGEPA